MAINRSAGFTLVELLVVISIIGVLCGLMLPAVNSAREASRRADCANHVRQINLALNQYVETHRKFPPGAVLKPLNYPALKAYLDPWLEASGSGSDDRGISWMVYILPYIELNNLYSQWNFSKSVLGNEAVAKQDVQLFYCPSRRMGIRPGDEQIMFKNWKSGGTDYGGCLGGGNGWLNSYSSYPGPPHISHDFLYGTTLYRKDKVGIFAPNSTTTSSSILDGLSNTIMIGEMQRLQPKSFGSDYEYWNCTSNDGWATAGVATLFDTMYIDKGSLDKGAPGGLNNWFFESAGSEHPGGANFGFADGSVSFIREDIDSQLFEWLGSINDGKTSILP